MTKYQNLIHKFLSQKNTILYNLTGCLLMTTEDLEEIVFFEDCYIHNFFNKLENSLNYVVLNGDLCLWCSMGVGCRVCTYFRRRWVICDADDSIYTRIRLKVENRGYKRFYDIPEVKILVKHALEEYHFLLTTDG